MKLEVVNRPHNGRDAKGKLHRYEVGSIYDGTERELAAFGDRLRRVEAKSRRKPQSEPSEALNGDAS